MTVAMRFTRNCILWKLLQKYDAPNLIFRLVFEFLYPTYTQCFEKFKRQQQTVCFYINVARSRKNGFDGHEEHDTDHSEWVFCIPRFDAEIISSMDDFGYRYEVSLQGINCYKCGEYEYCRQIGAPDIIRCKCPKMY